MEHFVPTVWLNTTHPDPMQKIWPPRPWVKYLKWTTLTSKADKINIGEIGWLMKLINFLTDEWIFLAECLVSLFCIKRGVKLRSSWTRLHIIYIQLDGRSQLSRASFHRRLQVRAVNIPPLFSEGVGFV